MLPTSKPHSKIMSGVILIIALAASASPACAENGWITGTVSQSGGTIFGIPIPGDPIAGATVAAVGTTQSTQTSPDGSYNLTVPVGNHSLQASATGFNSKTSGPITVTAFNTTAYQDFILERPSGNLTGTVVDADDGAPINLVIISYPSGGLLPPSAITDSSGRYLITNLPVGALQMNLTTLPPYGSFNFTVQIRAGQTTNKNFELRALSYIITVVKDSGGKPIPGATVTAGNYTGTTDASGSFMLEVRSGSYDMQVTADGYTTAKLQVAVEKGQISTHEVKLPKTGGGGGTAGGGGTMLLVAGAAAGVVVVLGAVGFVLMRKKKKAAAAARPGMPGSGMAPPAYGAAATSGQPFGEDVIPVPGRPKTQAEKMKEWADFERMYGRPHPEAPGWVSGASAHNAPKPKCPVDDVVVSFEPYSGQYFCSKCHERYPAEKVFRHDQAPPQQPSMAPRPSYQPPAASPYAPSGPQEQPSWATQTQTTPMAAPPFQPSPLPPPPPPPPPPATADATLQASQAIPTGAPMEAQPVMNDGEVPEAKPMEADVIPPGTGPVFNLPPPVNYEDGTVPPPPHKPPQNPPEQ